jgi:hypothetical protein
LSRVISNSTRRAKAKLFLEHTWMKYSKTQDSVYCAPCRFFGPYMLIVFDSKSSVIHYTIDKIKCLSQLHICIILLYLIIFYFSKFMFKSWLVAHENWVSVGSFLMPGNCKNAGFCTIYPRPPAVRPPLRGGGGFRDPPPDF